MKQRIQSPIRARLRSLAVTAALLIVNTLPAFAQAGGGTGFNSTDLKTGISNSLAVIMMFGFVLGIASVIYGGKPLGRAPAHSGEGWTSSAFAEWLK